MPRAKKHEEHENHERWLVSYADFITLLFAFFVVMYSISSVNEGKYRVLSDSLEAAFRSAAKSIAPIQIGAPARSPAVTSIGQRKIPIAVDLPEMPSPRPAKKRKVDKPEQKKQPETDKEKQKQLGDIGDKIEKAMAPLIQKGLIKIRRNKFFIEVDIKSKILFFSGSAQLSSAAIPVLERLADILRPHRNILHVEGFTDNVPINSEIYPSNWELSASRAASVVHLFTRTGVAPERMVALGFAEFKPVASNATEEGRARNRRVVLVIKADKASTALIQGLQNIDRPGQKGPAKTPTPAPGKKPEVLKKQPVTEKKLPVVEKPLAKAGKKDKALKKQPVNNAGKLKPLPPVPSFIKLPQIPIIKQQGKDQ